MPAVTGPSQAQRVAAKMRGVHQAAVTKEVRCRAGRCAARLSKHILWCMHNGTSAFCLYQARASHHCHSRHVLSKQQARNAQTIFP